ncbi:MAG: hypothetical protein EZS28_027769, partial [Streblomastix strix]
RRKEQQKQLKKQKEEKRRIDREKLKKEKEQLKLISQKHVQKHLVVGTDPLTLSQKHLNVYLPDSTIQLSPQTSQIRVPGLFPPPLTNGGGVMFDYDKNGQIEQWAAMFTKDSLVQKLKSSRNRDSQQHNMIINGGEMISQQMNGVYIPKSPHLRQQENNLSQSDPNTGQIQRTSSPSGLSYNDSTLQQQQKSYLMPGTPTYGQLNFMQPLKDFEYFQQENIYNPNQRKKQQPLGLSGLNDDRRRTTQTSRSQWSQNSERKDDINQEMDENGQITENADKSVNNNYLPSIYDGQGGIRYLNQVGVNVKRNTRSKSVLDSDIDNEEINRDIQSPYYQDYLSKQRDNKFILKQQELRIQRRRLVNVLVHPLRQDDLDWYDLDTRDKVSFQQYSHSVSPSAQLFNGQGQTSIVTTPMQMLIQQEIMDEKEKLLEKKKQNEKDRLKGISHQSTISFDRVTDMIQDVNTVDKKMYNLPYQYPGQKGVIISSTNATSKKWYGSVEQSDKFQELSQQQRNLALKQIRQQQSVLDMIRTKVRSPGTPVVMSVQTLSDGLHQLAELQEFQNNFLTQFDSENQNNDTTNEQQQQQRHSPINANQLKQQQQIARYKLQQSNQKQQQQQKDKLRWSYGAKWEDFKGFEYENRENKKQKEKEMQNQKEKERIKEQEKDKENKLRSMSPNSKNAVLAELKKTEQLEKEIAEYMGLSNLLGKERKKSD